jgi:3-phosphoshikimate 1-carboxyvinyltransferase
MLQWFGAALSQQDTGGTYVVSLDGPQTLAARDISIPGDISSAAYFVAAAGLLPNSDLVIDNVGLNPTRTAFLSVFESLGLTVKTKNVREESNEPLGSIHVAGRQFPLQSQTILSGSNSAQVIDELPLLAVLGSQTPGGMEIRDAEELRLKESDRIAATVKNLRAMGATVKEFDDGMIVNPAQLKGARLESNGDHRIAMAFTVAALMAAGESEIDDAECVRVSFPDFFEVLESLVER